MDVEILSRLQFAFTVGFHYIFPPLSIGLGLLLVIMEGLYLATRKEIYLRMTRFWVKIFALIFSVGVASGIVMEFQFGTNWSTYSRYVGDVFGSALAAEGVFAFFMESGFLALMLFGFGRVRPWVHYLSTVMVAFGSHFSAIWIVVANSWQQTPAGHHLVESGGTVRAEIVDFWAVVFNPSFLDRITHTLFGAWQAGAWLVLSASAFYLLRRRHQDIARAAIPIALVVALVASLGQLVTGHSSADTVAETQPAKMAAMEAHYPESAPGDLALFGWVDEGQQRVVGVSVPGMLSWLLHGDTTEPVTGLEAFEERDRPPVQIVFQAYHLMVAIGMGLIGLSVLGLLLLPGQRLYRMPRVLWLFVLTVLLPQLANQLGWITAEVGRQPWIVYGLLRTEEALSPTVSAGTVLWSLVLFGLIYGLLFVLFLFLMDRKIRHGPEPAGELTSTHGLFEGGPRA